MAKALAEGQKRIISELDATQGSPQDLGGYYRPDPLRTAAVMRPSKTLNAIIDGV